MVKKYILLIAVILSFYGCNTSNTKKDNQIKISSSPVQQILNSNSSIHNYQALSKLSLEELNTINRNLSVIARENFRSWSYTEPERWKYLSDKFADEVIKSCPDASQKKEDIAKILLKHLNQRSLIYFSNAKNKVEMLGKSGAEFNYNLSFLIGIEGFQKWQLSSKNELQKFTQIRDSLIEVIECSEKKIKN